MSIQAHLVAVDDKTLRTPQEIVDLSRERAFGADSRSADVLAWLGDEFGLGRGHAPATVQMIKNAPGISEAHVASEGTYRGDSAVLRLDGKAARTQPGT